ncbi:MAG: hypothetical protein J6A04_03500 [Clostridia bacterium]|nr:hypothetical protein [Clostridia bacterium]
MIGKVVLSFIATICFFTLVVYDFLGVCRIFGREKIVEEIWKRILPNKKYDEKIVFVLIRPIFLNISFLCFLLTYNIVNRMLVFRILLALAPILSVITGIKNRK